MAKKKKTKRSPAYELCAHIWRHKNAALGHSWERVNHNMAGALDLAIKAGLCFEPDDIRDIGADFRGGYWLYNETTYSLACQADNISAAQSCENAIGRKPFIADNVGPGQHNRSYSHLIAERKRGRLAIGFSFPWEAWTVTVTSFADDGESLVACAYKRSGDGDRKVIKRFTITHKMIQEDRAARKAANKIKSQ